MFTIVFVIGIIVDIIYSGLVRYESFIYTMDYTLYNAKEGFKRVKDSEEVVYTRDLTSCWTCNRTGVSIFSFLFWATLINGISFFFYHSESKHVSTASLIVSIVCLMGVQWFGNQQQ